MQKKAKIFSAFMSAFILLGFMEPVDTGSATNIPHWHFVDEIIIDQPPEFRSDLFFADKATIAQDDKNFTVSISHIIMTEVAGSRSLKDQITDLRSQMTIDCGKRTYLMMGTQKFDGEGMLLDAVTPVEEHSVWVRPESDEGFGRIIKLVCEADAGSAEQKFPGHIQPLTALLAYLNADWSK